MTKVAGLDLSLARTGYASPDGYTFSLRPKAGPLQPARRLHQLTTRLDQLLRSDVPDLAVLENYSYGSPNPTTIAKLAELAGAVKLRLFELAVPFVLVPPTSLKKWATGHGGASKDEMLAAAQDRAEAAGVGVVTNHDEADAYLLRALGMAYAHVVPSLANDSDDVERKLLRWLKGGSL